MPIFEQDEPIRFDEMKRQQKALNAKVKRKEFAEEYDSMTKQLEGHDGGDCKEDEDDDE